MPLPSTERERLKRFLYDTVENLNQLSILVWLHQRRHRPFATSAVARGVCLTPGVARAELQHLLDRQLVTRIDGSDAVQYVGPDPETSELVDLLVAAHTRDPAAVMQLLGSSAIERVRRAAWKTFSECARLGAEKPKT